MSDEITVKVGTFPGVLKEVVVMNGTTVRELLKMPDVDLVSDGYEIRMNSCIVEDDVCVENGVIFLVKNIKGNQN